MRRSESLFTIIAATVLLGVLAASASAGRLSSSTQSMGANWTRMAFSGGFGTAECETTLSGTLHRRAGAKRANRQVGYITAGNISRCPRGGATILRETLPWSVTYRGFGGTLPNITAISTNVVGVAFKLREPSIGATCLARSTASSPNIATLNRTGTGAITSITASGSIPCNGAIGSTGTISGTSSTNTAMTVTLI